MRKLGMAMVTMIVMAVGLTATDAQMVIPRRHGALIVRRSGNTNFITPVRNYHHGGRYYSRYGYGRSRGYRPCYGGYYPRGYYPPVYYGSPIYYTPYYTPYYSSYYSPYYNGGIYGSYYGSHTGINFGIRF
ncbi:MAG: hypothetical protein GXP25_10560 [Planctomycetes bacterium]|nr:hypothetical protein [Planctomycetota bacterium]